MQIDNTKFEYVLHETTMQRDRSINVHLQLARKVLAHLAFWILLISLWKRVDP